MSPLAGGLSLRAQATREPAGSTSRSSRGSSISAALYVDPGLRGHGVGEKLVRQALDWAREEGLGIPSCWFVDTVVRRHPEYEPLLER
jgi:predicted GNAT family acetyltransferase